MLSPSPKMIPLSHVGRYIAAITGKPSPSPRLIYNKLLQGAFPGESINGRWFIPERALPEIVHVLGLTA